MLFCKSIHNKCICPVSSLVSRAGIRKKQHLVGGGGQGWGVQGVEPGGKEIGF